MKNNEFKYVITTELKIRVVTCGELIKELDDCKWDYHRIKGWGFIDPNNPTVTIRGFSSSMDWIETRNKNKKLYIILEEKESSKLYSK